MPKQATSKRAGEQSFSEMMSQRLYEGMFILTIAISLFLLIALASFSQTDPSWSHTASQSQVVNAGGKAGAWFADVFLYVFGYLAYLFPVMLVYITWLLLHEGKDYSLDYRLFALRLAGFLLILAGGCGMASLQLPHLHAHLPFSAGGIIGNVIGFGLAGAFNPVGAVILLLAVFLVGSTLFTGVSWLKAIDALGRWTLVSVNNLIGFSMRGKEWFEQSKQERQERREHQVHMQRIEAAQRKVQKKKEKPKIKETADKVKVSKRYQQEQQVQLFDTPVEGSLPPLTLLDKAEKSSKKGYSTTKLEEMSREVEQRLLDFGIDAQVVSVHPGPVVTRYELQLAPGLKVSRISGLAKDLARSLSVISVRVVEVIPGKSVIGLELPNENREVVRLSEVLATERYDQARSPISLALGKDISGHPVIVDLAKMPHLLVAGTTGSGKSVGLNAMLLSILFKATPEEVRLILIDPKMLELSIYDGIPHLLTPVVTDMKEAQNSLRWCVGEMERRYRLMASLGVRNLAGFNNKVREAVKKGSPLLDPFWQAVDGEQQPALEPLPMIVVVIDELADMMMVVGKKVEQLIARIAQKARAAGIHLILATQRPSVDVITGLIKSNVPTRIAFQVSSKIDSRTIIDQSGADQLLGHGDMLYLAPGTGTPVRVHGAFVDDHEVHKVTSDWQRRGEPDFVDEILEGPSDINDVGLPTSGDDDVEDQDELYDEAILFVTQTRKASISSVQRRFKIGYNRAARLVEEMERTGVVSPMESNGSREVLAPPPVGD